VPSLCSPSSGHTVQQKLAIDPGIFYSITGCPCVKPDNMEPDNIKCLLGMPMWCGMGGQTLRRDSLGTGLNVPYGLRIPPLLPLMLTDLSADHARASPSLPVPGFLDNSRFVRSSSGLRSHWSPGLAYYLVRFRSSYQIHLGNSFGPAGWDKSGPSHRTQKLGAPEGRSVNPTFLYLHFRYTTGEGGWGDGQKLKRIYLPWELNRSPRQVFISHGQKINLNYFPTWEWSGLGGSTGIHRRLPL